MHMCPQSCQVITRERMIWCLLTDHRCFAVSKVVTGFGQPTRLITLSIAMLESIVLQWHPSNQCHGHCNTVDHRMALFLVVNQ